jgi:hypothetical protein
LAFNFVDLERQRFGRITNCANGRGGVLGSNLQNDFILQRVRHFVASEQDVLIAQQLPDTKQRSESKIRHLNTVKIAKIK